MSTHQIRVEPYLYFNGRCQEAVDFYGRTVGAAVTALSRFKDAPSIPVSPGAEEKIMHAALSIGDATVLASDGHCQGAANFDGFSLTLTTNEDDEAERMFAALSDEGSVAMPLDSTPFASRFGMVTDRFGVLWTVVSQAA